MIELVLSMSWSAERCSAFVQPAFACRAMLGAPRPRIRNLDSRPIWRFSISHPSRIPNESFLEFNLVTLNKGTEHAPIGFMLLDISTGSRVLMEASLLSGSLILPIAVVGLLCLLVGLWIRSLMRKPNIGPRTASREDLSELKTESLGLMAGGMAHDFNNMLTSILGNATLARMEMEPNSEVDVCLAEIESASLQASELCSQMLIYSGKGDFNVAPLDLEGLVATLKPSLQELVPPNISLQFESFDGSLPVEADTEQIRKLIQNLVTNASEAIGDQPGLIRIKTGLTSLIPGGEKTDFIVFPARSGIYCSLEVSDTGCGMNPSLSSKIFDPFFTTKPARRGLGLAAVLGIVRGHGGGLKLVSEPQKGTAFTVLLPGADPSDPEAVSPKGRGIPG